MRSLMTRSKPLSKRRGRARSAMAVSSFCLWNRDTTFVRANATSFEVVNTVGAVYDRPQVETETSAGGYRPPLDRRRQRSIKIGFELGLHILGKLLPLPSNVENVYCPVAFRGDECNF